MRTRLAELMCSMSLGGSAHAAPVDMDLAAMAGTAAIRCGGDEALPRIAASLSMDPDTWRRGVLLDRRTPLIRVEGCRIAMPFFCESGAPVAATEAVTDRVIDDAFELATGVRWDAATDDRAFDLPAPTFPPASLPVVVEGDGVVVDGRVRLRSSSAWHARVVAECLASTVALVECGDAPGHPPTAPKLEEREEEWLHDFFQLTVVQSWQLLTIVKPSEMLATGRETLGLPRDSPAARLITDFRRSEARAAALSALVPALSRATELARLCLRARLGASPHARACSSGALDLAAAEGAEPQVIRWLIDVLADTQPTAPSVSSSFVSVRCMRPEESGSLPLFGPSGLGPARYVLDCESPAGIRVHFVFESGAEAALAINALESVHDLTWSP
jgi:hypothetical protein